MAAAFAVEGVVEAISLIVTAAVEKAVEGAVVEAVTVAVTNAVTAAVAAAVTSAVIGAVTAATTAALQDSLNKTLSAQVKAVIGAQGIADISAAAAIPADVVIGILLYHLNNTIYPHLKALQDPFFQRFTRLLRALRVAQRGKRPDDDEEDDECEEENCRYFEGDMTDSLNDFIFFSVYGSEECIEGDEVYSASAPWGVIQSLVDDPIAGHYVVKLFTELLDTTDDEEAATPYLLQVKATKTIKKITKVKYGTLVSFGGKKVYNVKGSSVDKRKPSWVKAYLKTGYGKCGHCYIASSNPSVLHNNPLTGNIVGGHVWNPTLKNRDKSLYYYILPICRRHNKSVVYDDPKSGNWLKTEVGAKALKITSVKSVPGWKQKKNHMKGFVGTKMEAALLPESLKKMSLSSGEPCKPTEIPRNIEEWLGQQIDEVAQEFAKTVIDTVFKEVFATVMEKMGEIIKAAGKAAQDWAKRQGSDIDMKSLIPFYGWFMAGKRLRTLKGDAIGRFHDGARSGIRNYKNTCLGEGEQNVRKQRLMDETNKVISSEKWKQRLSSIEEGLIAALPDLIEKGW